MTALAAAKKIVQKDGPDFVGPYGVKADAIIYHGAMVGIDTTGNQAVPATTAIAPHGVADMSIWDDQTKTGTASTFGRTTHNKIDNTGGADGDRKVVLRQGAFKFGNKGGDLVTIALMGQSVYVADDQTVQATGGGAVAGKLIGIDDDGLPIVAVGVGASYGEAI